MTESRKARCPHHTLTITETGTWYTQHDRNHGKWTHNNEPGCYDRSIAVFCSDCGYERMHWRGDKKMPRWLRNALEEIANQGVLND